MSEKVDITIIGAGVIGCAVAYRIASEYTGLKDIVVIERNSQINGENQSSRNSGVIHAGVYYPSDVGPLKAKLCVEDELINSVLEDKGAIEDIFSLKDFKKFILHNENLEYKSSNSE